MQQSRLKDPCWHFGRLNSGSKNPDPAPTTAPIAPASDPEPARSNAEKRLDRRCIRPAMAPARLPAPSPGCQGPRASQPRARQPAHRLSRPRHQRLVPASPAPSRAGWDREPPEQNEQESARFWHLLQKNSGKFQESSKTRPLQPPASRSIRLACHILGANSGIKFHL